MNAKKGSIPLIRVHPEPGATKFFLQAGHRQTAIEAAVAYVNAGFAQALSEQTNDSLSAAVSAALDRAAITAALASIEPPWVIETIYQGAYLREYHLWEKSCKEYFLPKDVDMAPPRGVTFTEHVKKVLWSHFG